MGIDASLRATGIGLIDATGSQLKHVAHKIIKTSSSMLLSRSLKILLEGIKKTIEEYQPSIAAVEGIFFCRNIQTAITLGEARGVVIASCVQANLPIFEYEPRKIKQAVVGFGSASKEQMQKMIKSLLGLKSMPGEDESDALAIAICHAHNMGHEYLSKAKEI